MTDSSRIRTVYVSDEAYRGLMTNAQRGTGRGLSAYVTALLTESNLTRFRDARPDEIRADDEGMRAAGYAPTWRLHEYSRARNLKLSDETITQACGVCLLLGIATMTTKRLKGAPTYRDGLKCLSRFLEAYGTGWITLEGGEHA